MCAQSKGSINSLLIERQEKNNVILMIRADFFVSAKISAINSLYCLCSMWIHLAMTLETDINSLFLMSIANILAVRFRKCLHYSNDIKQFQCKMHRISIEAASLNGSVIKVILFRRFFCSLLLHVRYEASSLESLQQMRCNLLLMIHIFVLIAIVPRFRKYFVHLMASLTGIANMLW